MLLGGLDHVLSAAIARRPDPSRLHHPPDPSPPRRHRAPPTSATAAQNTAASNWSSPTRSATHSPHQQQPGPTTPLRHSHTRRNPPRTDVATIAVILRLDRRTALKRATAKARVGKARPANAGRACPRGHPLRSSAPACARRLRRLCPPYIRYTRRPSTISTRTPTVMPAPERASSNHGRSAIAKRIAPMRRATKTAEYAPAIPHYALSQRTAS